MLAEVRVPEIGESITEGTLVQWFKEDGDIVGIDEPLFELETDKVTLEVPSEFAGALHILVPAGERVTIGQVVATVDTAAAGQAQASAPAQPVPADTGPAPAPPSPDPARPGAAPPPPPHHPSPPPPPHTTVPQTEGPPLVPPAGLDQAAAKAAGMARSGAFSPAVRRMIEEFGLDPGAIQGTGREGRITKEDVVRHLNAVRSRPAPPEAPTPQAPSSPAATLTPPPPRHPPAPISTAPTPSERQTRRPMSPLRQRIAERLVQAQQTAAMLTTFNEADMTNVFAWRQRHKQAFKERYDIGLGFMSFFVKASVDALKTVPQVNAFIDGDEIVENHYYDIGVAISSDRGLVVPVIRDADRLSFAEIELAIADLARRVRDRKITLNDLSGGVFTISNGGVFGSLMSTPILNPPQSAILGMHAVKRRPVVVGDQIVIRPMMYLALSYDHRVVDGREAVTFLKRIVQCIEDPERMLLEV